MQTIINKITKEIKQSNWASFMHLMNSYTQKWDHHENMPIFDPLKPHFYIVKLGFAGV